MSIKNQIIRGILKWLWVKYPFQFKDIMLADKMHVHKNPTRKDRIEPDIDIKAMKRGTE